MLEFPRGWCFGESEHASLRWTPVLPLFTNPHSSFTVLQAFVPPLFCLAISANPQSSSAVSHACMHPLVSRAPSYANPHFSFTALHACLHPYFFLPVNSSISALPPRPSLEVHACRLIAVYVHAVMLVAYGSIGRYYVCT